jgi:hypothetical protein
VQPQQHQYMGAAAPQAQQQHPLQPHTGMHGGGMQQGGQAMGGIPMGGQVGGGFAATPNNMGPPGLSSPPMQGRQS